MAGFLGTIRQGDERIRQFAAAQAEAARARKEASIKRDLLAQLNSGQENQLGSATNRINDIYARDYSEDYDAFGDMRVPLIPVGRTPTPGDVSMAAIMGSQGPLAQTLGAIGSRGTGAGITRGVIYGGALTAAGQQLAALSDYLSQGDAAQVARETSPLL